MPSAAFEPAIPAIKQLHTYALYCPATGIGIMHLYCFDIPSSLEFCYKLRRYIGVWLWSIRFRNSKRTVSDTRTQHNLIFAASVFLVSEGWYYGLL